MFDTLYREHAAMDKTLRRAAPSTLLLAERVRADFTTTQAGLDRCLGATTFDEFSQVTPPEG